ncbi:MAG: hypothetical protein ACPW61_02115 [Methyloligella sp. ZOD6]
MAVSLNGLNVLGKMSANAKVFSDIRPDVDKQARSLVVKQIKAKPDLDSVRAVKKAIGPSPFDSVLDGMSDAEVRTLLNKMDPHNKDLKKARPAARRDHLRALTSGKAKLVAPPETETKKRPAKRKPRRTLDLTSMKTKAKR